MSNPFPSIVRINKVVDTRTYEEQGDRWVPIPGSGTENECARCGRLHKVHAEVELSDGKTVIVGTGCMSKESVEVQSRLRSGAERAKRIAKAKAEITKLEHLALEHARIRAEVSVLSLPPIVDGISERAVGRDREPQAKYTMGDVSVLDFVPPGTPISRERRYTLESFWRDDQAKKRGETYLHTVAKDRAEEVKRRLAALERAAAK